MTDMLIRDYSRDDRQSCIEIFTSNVPTFFACHELKEFEKWLDSQEIFKLTDADQQLDFYYVVEVEKRIVACGGFHLPQDTVYATMVWGMVEKSFHKKGIGSKFLEYRIKRIKLLKPNVHLLLDTTQHSYKFFEKLGFKVTKLTKDYYAKGLDRYDMVG